MASNLKTLSIKSSSSGSQKFMNPMDIQQKVNNNLVAKDLFDRLLQDLSFSQDYCNRSSDVLSAQNSKIIEQMNLSPRQQHAGCKCSKIDCLKLYCQCFAKGKACNSLCSCTCCKNTHENKHQIYKAQQVANFRHPGFFKGVPSFVPSKKCTCKKSLCRKKYCECYSAGQKCTQECQCNNCHNQKPHDHHQQMSSMMQIQNGEVFGTSIQSTSQTRLKLNNPLFRKNHRKL